MKRFDVFFRLSPAPSDDGLVGGLLGGLGGQRVLGGVATFGVGHQQAHLLIGPPPLRVELTVVAERHLEDSGVTEGSYI